MTTKLSSANSRVNIVSLTVEGIHVAPVHLFYYLNKLIYSSNSQNLIQREQKLLIKL